MTRMHFKALADVLKATRPDSESTDLVTMAKFEQWIIDARAIADTCGRFNPQFDRARFLDACGVE